MTWIIEQRIKELIQYHEGEDVQHPRKLTIELGDLHSDALNRLCILEGMTKTALIRHLIAQHVLELGGQAVMDSPADMYNIIARSSALDEHNDE
jgi:ribosomal protein S15P/S13E